MDSLKLDPRHLILGAGIYTAGSAYDRMFVTDSGRWIAITGRVITEDDLLKAYKWGREDEVDNPYTEEPDDPSIPSN